MNKKTKTVLRAILIFITIFLIFLLCKNSFIINDGNITPIIDPKVEKLTKIGYKTEEITKLINNLSESEINTLTIYDKNLPVLTENKYFVYENIERYIDYINANNKNINTSIIEVNIGIDNDFYTNITEITDQNNLLVTVNKYNKLSSTYEPDDLVNFEGTNVYLRKEAKESLDSAIKDAKKEGITITPSSGYRSYTTQSNIYNRYLTYDTKEEVDTYSARPGHSEHQTGLAIDLGSITDSFAYTDSFAWMQKNAYKYGFIMSYPSDKVYLTGYKHEPWHWRYVGIEAATVIFNEKITLDEYIVKYKTTY